MNGLLLPIWQALKKKSVEGIAVVLIGGVVVILIEPVRDFAVGMVAVPDRLTGIELTQSDILDDIDRLKQPEQIFELARSSAPLAGFVTGGQNDKWRLRLRRTPSGASCNIIRAGMVVNGQPHGGTEWYYFNPRTNEISNTTRISGTASTDLSRTWTNIDAVIYTPTGLAPDAELCIKPWYLGCPGQNSFIDPDTGAVIEQPITQEAECVPVPVTPRN